MWSAQRWWTLADTAVGVPNGGKLPPNGMAFRTADGSSRSRPAMRSPAYDHQSQTSVPLVQMFIFDVEYNFFLLICWRYTKQEDGTKWEWIWERPRTIIAEPSGILKWMVPDAGDKSGIHIFMTSTSAYGTSVSTWLPSVTKKRISLQGVSAINREGSWSLCKVEEQWSQSSNQNRTKQQWWKCQRFQDEHLLFTNWIHT